jgi:hypothetical protein
MRKLINMLYKYKGTELGARLIHPYRSPRETLAATSSRPNSEALTACVVLAHSYAVFYPCTDGLLIDAATVATALIDYDDVKITVETTTRRRRS